MNSDTCTRPSNKTRFNINLIIHVLILFTFLLMFFMFYISRLERDTFKEQIHDIIDTNLSNVLNTLNEGDKTELKNALKLLPYDTLNKLYSKASTDISEHNKWLFRIAGMGVAVLIIAIIAIIFTLKYSCNQCVSWGPIILENVVIFSFVGLIEYMFFTRIISKYTPAPPSLMIKSLIDSIKENL